ncbi:MAG: NADH-quinone oxidoreductase subunit J [Elusimicrobia bacterium]|nr:NADH-quinone oxidoreductase subunit J [Elusimicrobiota bacterium]
MAATALAICGGCAVLFAAFALFQRTLYGSALCLLAVLLQVGAAYFLIGAPLLGLIQVLVYAGAVMVLLVVAVMSSPPQLNEPWAGGTAKWLAWLAVLAPAAELLSLLRAASGAPAALQRAPAALERQMAFLLFGPYAPLTEIAGLLVLVAALSILRESHE